MGRSGGGDFPLFGGSDDSGSDVSGVDDGRKARKRAASVYVYVLANWEMDSRVPIVGKDTFLFVKDTVGEAFGWRRAVDVEGVFFADGLVPAAKKEAGVVDVVVEVVVGEE